MTNNLQKYLGSMRPLDSNLLKELMAPMYSMKDLTELNPHITYRTVNHWNEKKYLLTEKVDANWRRFSFSEFIWLLLLDEIREMEVSFKDIVPAIILRLWKDYHAARGDDVDITELIGLDYDQIIQKINKSEVLEEFAWRLVSIISYKNPLTIRIFKDRTCFWIYGNQSYFGIEFMKEQYLNDLNESNLKSSISISIDSLIINFISRKDLNNIKDLNLLSTEEVEVLESIRNQELSKIIVKLKNGKPFAMELVDEKNSIDASKRIVENFLTDYSECTYKRNGKDYYFKRVTKKKL